ncbi:MAG: hypothetical protein Q8Q92_02240 [bacterium]|nr:hypothetical protein [bacterium]
MSTVLFGSFGQAARTLDVVAEQRLSTEEVEMLNNGYLTDLSRAIRMGTVPARDIFQKFLGLTFELKVWKTVKLGTAEIRTMPINNPNAKCHLYHQVLEGKGFKIGTYASQILNKVTVSQTKTEVDLGVLTVAELGFKGNARYDAICTRIVEIGGELCPAEVGPALRNQYENQPNGEWNLIAMKALAASGGALDVFRVDRAYGGQWLHAYRGLPGILYYPGSRVVFVVPRNYRCFSPLHGGEFTYYVPELARTVLELARTVLARVGDG